MEPQPLGTAAPGPAEAGHYVLVFSLLVFFVIAVVFR